MPGRKAEKPHKAGTYGFWSLSQFVAVLHGQTLAVEIVAQSSPVSAALPRIGLEIGQVVAIEKTSRRAFRGDPPLGYEQDLSAAARARRVMRANHPRLRRPPARISSISPSMSAARRDEAIKRLIQQQKRRRRAKARGSANIVGAPPDKGFPASVCQIRPDQPRFRCHLKPGPRRPASAQ